MATSGIGSISSAGIGSGLDVSSIVTQLMAVEQRPLEQLKSQATSLGSKLSTVGKLQGYFSALRDKANALTLSTLWSATTATSANTAVKVSTGPGAVAGSYAVAVTRLAQGQTLISGALPASTSTLNEGTLTIELGQYLAGTPAAGFNPKAGSSPVTINIGSGETSLATVRDKINSANAGITATLITDASGTRLSLRSNDTGAENAFRVAVTEAVDDNNPATGLSALAYDAAAAASSPMLRKQAADNSDLTINGIQINTASNTLNDVVDGLTLNLSATTTGPVDVSVTADTTSIKTAITDFVAAFNTLASFIKAQTAYNADSKSGGALQGDQSTLSLQNQLRGVINEGSSASSVWSRLSDIGLAMKVDGTLDTNAGKLDNALGKLAELKKLLATDGASSAESGFVRRFKQLADAALGSEGVFESRSATLRANVTRNSKSQEAMEQRLAQTRARLQSQYSALDTKMATLGNLSTYMTQQIAQFNKSTG